jgi:hypothetical protein
MEAEQFINNAAAELEMVEAQLRDAEARAAALRSRGDGLRFLIQYGQEAQATGGRPQELAAPVITSVGTDSAAPGFEVAQTERVERAVIEIGRAAMTGEIKDKANVGPGPILTHEQVRSALGYLMRKRPPRVERVRPGVWRAPKAAASPAAFTPSPLAVAAMNGSGREP